jgi:hypothetical protein
MITCIIGLTGAGKTWFLTRLLHERWKAGANIISYHKLYFSEKNERIKRFWQLSDLYSASNATIGFPELQKLLNAKNWASLPEIFADAIVSQGRHNQLDLIGDTQGLSQIDVYLRRNIHELYVCRTILRIPINQNKLPLFHWISVEYKTRYFDEKSDDVKFKKNGKRKWYFISRLWTKKLYDTFEKSQLKKFALWVSRKKEKWTVHMINRRLIAAGKRRRT